MGQPEQIAQYEGIAGDRRDDRRYQICLDVQWKLIRRKKVLHTGDGQTLDLSSGGLLFDARRPLPPGFSVELSIAWPVLLNDVATMRLSITGRIIRSSGNRIAIRMIQHEFRTGPLTANSRPLAMLTASALPSNVRTLR